MIPGIDKIPLDHRQKVMEAFIPAEADNGTLRSIDVILDDHLELRCCPLGYLCLLHDPDYDDEGHPQPTTIADILDIPFNSAAQFTTRFDNGFITLADLQLSLGIPIKELTHAQEER